MGEHVGAIVKSRWCTDSEYGLHRQTKDDCTDNQKRDCTDNRRGDRTDNRESDCTDKRESDRTDNQQGDRTDLDRDRTDKKGGKAPLCRVGSSNEPAKAGGTAV